MRMPNLTPKENFDRCLEELLSYADELEADIDSLEKTVAHLNEMSDLLRTAMEALKEFANEISRNE